MHVICDPLGSCPKGLRQLHGKSVLAGAVRHWSVCCLVFVLFRPGSIVCHFKLAFYQWQHACQQKGLHVHELATSCAAGLFCHSPCKPELRLSGETLFCACSVIKLGLFFRCGEAFMRLASDGQVSIAGKGCIGGPAEGTQVQAAG